MRAVLRVNWLLLAGFLLCTAAAAHASALRSGNRISISQGTTLNDEVYAFGQSVVVVGAVADDASIFANEIRIAESGSVAGSANIAGSSVDVAGAVGRNLRLAGSDVTVSGRVGGNAAIAGAEILIAGAGSVGRDLYAAGSNVDVQGRVGRKATINAEKVTVNAPIGGDVRIDAGKITIGSRAVINGDLVYTSPQKATIDPGARITGRTIHQRQTEHKSALGPLLWFLRFVGFISLFLTGLILLALAPKTTGDAAATAFAKPWVSMLIGFVFLIALPAVAVVLIFTLVGIPLALILAAMYLILIYVSRVVISLAVGNWLISRAGRTGVSRFTAFFVGLLAFVILTWIPVVGGFVSFVGLLLGLGALAWERYNFLRQLRAEERL